MRSIEEINAQSNALISDFLLIDSQTALLFLNRAEDESSRVVDRERGFQAAVTAYEAIEKYLPRTTLTREQYEALMKNLTVLREGLARYPATCGYKFPV